MQHVYYQMDPTIYFLLQTDKKILVSNRYLIPLKHTLIFDINKD